MVRRIKQWWNDNDGPAVLLWTAVTAFVTYFYYLKLEPINSDTFCEGLLRYQVFNSDVSLGRWMTPYCAMLTGGIINPAVYLSLYFFCNAIFSVFLIGIWKIQGKLYRVLTGTIIAVTPAIVGQTLYIYEMMTYVVSMLCIVTSLSILFRYSGFLSMALSAILFAISLGAFQANIALAVFVVLGYLLILLITEKKLDIVSFGKRIMRYLVYGAVGIAAYWILMVIHLKIYGLARPSYAGANEIGVVNTAVNAISHLRRPYRLAISYYKDTIMPGPFLWMILILIMAGCVFYQLYRHAKIHRYWAVAAIIIILLIMPPGLEIMDIIAPEHGIQLYWMYQMQVLAPLCIALISNTIGIQVGSKSDNLWKTILKRAGGVASALCVIGLTVIYSYCAYSSFRTLDIGSRHIKLIVKNALTHAIEDEKHEEEMPIVFIGFVNDDTVQEQNPLLKYSYYERAYPFWKDRYEVFSTWPKYCWYNYGIDIGQVTAEQYDNILKSDEFKNMEQYPSSKAYAVIDGCYVILLDRESVQ